MLYKTADGVYTMSMGVGDPEQMGYGIGVSTMARKMVVPAVDCITCTDNWYNEDTSTSY